MAWGWETANICQSKLSWVLLGFGEWKADKASPHTLGCTRQEESREDGTVGGGGGGGGVYCGFPLRGRTGRRPMNLSPNSSAVG